MATFHVPEVVRRYSAGVADVDVSGGTVAAVLDEVFERFPDLRLRVLDRDGDLYSYLVLFLDGRELARDGLMETSVPDGATVELVGAAEGG